MLAKMTGTELSIASRAPKIRVGSHTILTQTTEYIRILLIRPIHNEKANSISDEISGTHPYHKPGKPVVRS